MAIHILKIIMAMKITMMIITHMIIMTTVVATMIHTMGMMMHTLCVGEEEEVAEAGLHHLEADQLLLSVEGAPIMYQEVLPWALLEDPEVDEVGHHSSSNEVATPVVTVEVEVGMLVEKERQMGTASQTPNVARPTISRIGGPSL